MKKKILPFIYFFLCASVLLAQNVMAYIDPSAMTYIIQLVAGVAIAAGAAFGFYFRKIKRALSRMGNKGDRASDNWDYDEADTDDFGMGDYPILDSDRYEKSPVEEALAASGSDIGPDVSEPSVVDKYDERGADAFIELMRIKEAFAAEKAKTAALEKLLEAK